MNQNNHFEPSADGEKPYKCMPTAERYMLEKKTAPDIANKIFEHEHDRLFGQRILLHKKRDFLG